MDYSNTTCLVCSSAAAVVDVSCLKALLIVRVIETDTGSMSLIRRIYFLRILMNNADRKVQAEANIQSSIKTASAIWQSFKGPYHFG